MREPISYFGTESFPNRMDPELMTYDVNDFSTDVIERSKTVPVLVDFWAEWCGPCRVLGPVLERLAGKSGGRWELAKVNSDIHQEIARQYGVRGIPNVKLFIDGKVADEFTGALPERAVEQWLEKALPSPHRKSLAEANELLARGDQDGARTLLEDVLAKEGENHTARALLARILLFSDPQRAIDLVAPIEEDSDQFQLAESVRTIASVSQKAQHPASLPESPVKAAYLEAAALVQARDFDQAVEKYIEIVRGNREYDDDGARRTVVAIFKLMGDEDPVTVKHRRSFSSALFA